MTLIVEVAAGGGDSGGEGQEGQLHSWADGEGLHGDGGWSSADDQVLRAREVAG